MALISAKNITVKIGEKLILDDISLDIAANEIVTIIGPNGAGKTTLIKALLGVCKLTSGRIKKQPDLKIGYVPQKLNISPYMPINVASFLQLNAKYNTDIIKSALHDVQACELSNQQMKDLSGGQLQRILLARAIISKPNLLILDEPTQGMDIGGQIKFYEHIKEIRNRLNCGVILISHDLNMVMSATDKVICIHRHICCHGSPDDVTKDPEFAKIFGDKAMENLALYHHKHNHTHGGWDKSSCKDEHHG